MLKDKQGEHKELIQDLKKTFKGGKETFRCSPGVMMEKHEQIQRKLTAVSRAITFPVYILSK